MTCRCQEPDRRDAEIAQDLSAKADLAPLPRARLFRRGNVARRKRHRNARRCHRAGNDHAAAVVFEPMQRCWIGRCLPNTSLMRLARCRRTEHILAVADASINAGKVIDRIERRPVGVASQCPISVSNRKFADPFDQLIAGLAIRDQIGDRQKFEIVLARRTPAPRVHA